MSGLDEKQLEQLEERVAELLEEPWDKGTGRPREITFREALVITCGYMRQNIIEDVWADMFDVDQSTIHGSSHSSPRWPSRQPRNSGQLRRKQPKPPGVRSRW